MSGRKARYLVAIAMALLFAAVGTNAQMLGPTPYLSFSDSPFSGLSFSVFQLEDYEGAPLPGYTGPSAGVRLTPGAQTDSVDIDRGTINGSGIDGHSWFSNGQTGFFSFAFDAGALGGRLPTHAGIVWTDVGLVVPGPEAGSNPPTPPQGRIPVGFAAYGPGGSLIGFTGLVELGDGNPNGGTAEDRFFGVVSMGGISSIEIFVGDGGLVASNDWEVDHLQFGVANPIPEPEQWLLMALGVAAVAMRLRRRRRVQANLDCCD